MLNLSVETWLRFLAWLVIGLVIYFAYGHRHSRVVPTIGPARPSGRLPQNRADLPWNRRVRKAGRQGRGMTA